MEFFSTMQCDSLLRQFHDITIYYMEIFFRGEHQKEPFFNNHIGRCFLNSDINVLIYYLEV